jgi:hypothetical protein
VLARPRRRDRRVVGDGIGDPLVDARLVEGPDMVVPARVITISMVSNPLEYPGTGSYSWIAPVRTDSVNQSIRVLGEEPFVE